MIDLVRALQAELASLEAELAADPRYQKIGKIRELLAMYNPAQPESMPSKSVMAAPSANPSGRPGSLTSRVLAACTDYLHQKGSRAQTSELAAACVAVGVPLPESLTKQRDYVSSILSHSSKINNVRGQGYGLVEWPLDDTNENREISEPPDSASTLSGHPMLEGILPLSV